VAAEITRRSFLAGAAALSPSELSRSASYSFWVLGLLHPTSIDIYPYANSRLHVRSRVLEGSRGLTVDASQTPITVSGATKEPVSFVLDIPGVIRRRYHGVLKITSEGALLRPVVTMDREVAVGSIVGAELPIHGTPLAALSAQALAARSFLDAESSRPRHVGAQFCDTTHCQFLRTPPFAGSVVEKAVRATEGLVLSAHSRVIPAHYSAACGGHTDSAELDHYQYRSVICEPCQRAGTRRRGHGLGLCQTGAISLARAGWNFEEIVAKYYPGCAIQSA